MSNQDTTIAIGLSGGVDSSVSALLLKQQGFNVVAMHMQNWTQDQNDPHCSASEDLSDARSIADQIGVPLIVVNFAQEYWDRVFQYCLDEFAKARTPNPDIWCNREIKFNVFLEYAQQHGADFLATGHYVQSDKKTEHRLIMGSDPNKDQSYFLYTLNQHQLSSSVFPIGQFLKQDVRRIASDHGLITAQKKDSTGICFIGERRFKTFLQEFLIAKPGAIESPDGKVLGQHDGVLFYTIGQRSGLKIGGVCQHPELPWYVVAKDVKRNVLIAAQGVDHPLLYRTQLSADQVHWVSALPPTLPLHCQAKIRYRQSPQQCTVNALPNGRLAVQFAAPQRAITPGQSVVFYQGTVCLGGATIEDHPQ